MKKYLTLIIVFILLGAITGIVFITKSTTDINLEKKRQPKQEKVIIDETSFPPVNLETNIDDSTTALSFENPMEFLIQGKINNYLLLVPDYCNTTANEIICPKFTIEPITNPAKNYISSETFPAGEYDITIGAKDKETLITIKGEELIYLLIKGGSYKDIEKNIWEIISTFSVENPDL